MLLSIKNFPAALQNVDAEIERGCVHTCYAKKREKGAGGFGYTIIQHGEVYRTHRKQGNDDAQRSETFFCNGLFLDGGNDQGNQGTESYPNDEVEEKDQHMDNGLGNSEGIEERIAAKE